MKSLFYRIVNAIRMGWWCLLNPTVYHEATMGMLSGLYHLIFKAALEQRPYMSKIGIINCKSGEQSDFVTLWVGAGVDSSPTNRIEELLKLNQELERQNEILRNQISKSERKPCEN